MNSGAARKGRPKLELGTHGAIKASRVEEVWVARCWFRDVDDVGRAVTASGETEIQAIERLKVKLKRRPTRLLKPLTADSTVADVVPLWEESLHQLETTKDAYRRAVKRYIVPTLGQVRLGDIRVSMLDRFLRSLALKSHHSASLCRTVLISMFYLVVRDDVLPHNLVKETKLPPKKKTTVVALKPQALMELKADVASWAAKRKNRAVMVDVVDLFLTTGLRPGEVLAVRFEDVDLGKGTLHVCGTVKRDSVNGLHRQPHTKTDDGDRILILPRFAFEMIARRASGATSGLLFPNRNGQPMDPSSFRRMWREARGEKWAHVELRAFRRAIATLIARERGVADAAAQLGHANEEVTRKFYIEKDRSAPDSSELLSGFGLEPSEENHEDHNQSDDLSV